MPAPESAALFVDRQIARLRKNRPRKKIVFPEGRDPRVIAAAERLAEEGLVEPILLTGPPGAAEAERYAAFYYERRHAKGVTREEAAAAARQPLYHACLMAAAGDADGVMGGAANTTADMVRAALLTIGPAPRIDTVSGVYFMCVQDRAYGHDGVLAFADCAVVVEPSAEEIAEIALATAQSARTVLGTEPRVALLSFSTQGSARHPRAGKMIEALRILRRRAPDLEADGEFQADAALVAEVGASKAPGSRVAGRANTLIFPDLDSANLSYKLVQRLGGAAAYGPFLQGLAKPASDLSRGCSAGDIYAVAITLAAQCDTE